jgi:hypothetical protein
VVTATGGEALQNFHYNLKTKGVFLPTFFLKPVNAVLCRTAIGLDSWCPSCEDQTSSRDCLINYMVCSRNGMFNFGNGNIKQIPNCLVVFFNTI